MGDSPPITLYGVQILEPVTSLTDLITALVCFYAFYRLSKLDRHGKVYTYFRYYFLWTGIATTCAAFIGHAFLYLFSFEWKMIGWAFSATGILFIEWGTLHFIREEIPSYAAPGQQSDRFCPAIFLPACHNLQRQIVSTHLF